MRTRDPEGPGRARPTAALRVGGCSGRRPKSCDFASAAKKLRRERNPGRSDACFPRKGRPQGSAPAGPSKADKRRSLSPLMNAAMTGHGAAEAFQSAGAAVAGGCGVRLAPRGRRRAARSAARGGESKGQRPMPPTPRRKRTSRLRTPALYFLFRPCASPAKGRPRLLKSAYRLSGRRPRAARAPAGTGSSRAAQGQRRRRRGGDEARRRHHRRRRRIASDGNGRPGPMLHSSSTGAPAGWLRGSG